jgi:hypothetical protein
MIETENRKRKEDEADLFYFSFLPTYLLSGEVHDRIY